MLVQDCGQNPLHEAMGGTMTLISTEEAAQELGVTRRRVQALIRSGRLKAEKVGRSYVIRPYDLEAVRCRKPGRQPKK